MKIIYSNYLSVPGFSIVTLQNRNGKYTGRAWVHPEDMEYKSRFIGCEIAERRAWIEYYKSEIKKNKIQLQALNALKKDIYINSKDYAYQDSNKRIEIMIRSKNKEILKFKEKIKEAEDNIKNIIETREKIVEKYAKRSN